MFLLSEQRLHLGGVLHHAGGKERVVEGNRVTGKQWGLWEQGGCQK